MSKSLPLLLALDDKNSFQFLFQTDLTFLVNVFQIVSALAASIALIYTSLVYVRGKKTEQIKLAESIYKDIRELKKEPNKNNDWYYRFFDTLEWLSFLINRNEISNRDIQAFFKDVIEGAHESFMATFTLDEIDNPDFFPEFKLLHKRIRK